MFFKPGWKTCIAIIVGFFFFSLDDTRVSFFKHLKIFVQKWEFKVTNHVSICVPLLCLLNIIVFSKCTVIKMLLVFQKVNWKTISCHQDIFDVESILVLI